jgi:hypothetical protein
VDIHALRLVVGSLGCPEVPRTHGWSRRERRGGRGGVAPSVVSRAGRCIPVVRGMAL